MMEAKAKQYPMREDGTIDYLAVANRNFSEVSPEDNMLVDFVQCLGTDGFLESGSQFEFDFLEMLGNPEIPDHEFFVSADVYIQDHPDSTEDGLDEISTCYSTPWSAETFPLLAEWVEKQSSNLDQFVLASEKPYYFHPLCQEEGIVVAALLPYSQSIRDVTRALSLRAMYELHQGNIDGYARDVTAIRKIGLALTDSGTLIENLIGCASIYMAFEMEDELVSELAKGTAWPDEAIESYRSIVRETTKLPSLAGLVDRGEGLYIRDILQRMERGDLNSVQFAFGGQDSEAQSNLMKLAGRLVDWEAATEFVLKRHEQIVEALKIEDDAQRAAAIVKIETEIQQLESERNENVVKTALSALTSPRRRGEMIGGIMSAQLSPAMRAVNDARTRTLMLNLTDTALALELYRRKEGKFPDSLSELVPNYLDEVPTDRLRGEPASYVATDAGYRLWSWGVNRKDEQRGADNSLLPRAGSPGVNRDDLVIGVND